MAEAKFVDMRSAENADGYSPREAALWPFPACVSTGGRRQGDFSGDADGVEEGAIMADDEDRPVIGA